ncbi:helix-turn-helix domain-containing protein [Arcobacter porcinus]|uniref:Transcriptional regulator, XRE family n=1 Tax=Arcobacter porcinus TaxID=1935204 RepID=A0A5C2HBK1_9BACT|nr:helix-turn-helix domain-containing protein [Arcobacter porcinus]OCL91375.1 Bacteriophage CI repressor helix-turn-helix domain protein [Aliarcobacter thereius]QEP40307.1 transcriptional regulator, XRE family [Arcobacter porcinus]
MENFEKVINKLKKALNVSTDKELAEKLNMKNNTFSERKRTSSLPHNEILSICITEKLDLNSIYTDNTILGKSINYKEEIINNLEIFDEKQIKYFYHLMEAEKIRN